MLLPFTTLFYSSLASLKLTRNVTSIPSYQIAEYLRNRPVVKDPHPQIDQVILGLSRHKRKQHRRKNADERREVIPLQPLAENHDRESAQHGERHPLLNDLKLPSGIYIIAQTIRGNNQQVIKERNPPDRENSEPHGFLAEFQMPVPRKGHEHVRARQHHKRQPSRM